MQIFRQLISKKIYITFNGIAAPTMPTADVWHSIDGRSLSSRPTRRGIYIVGGKKVVIR